ncbi:MAG: riboflavin synthase [Planctomycetota bacterium]
MFTGLVAAVGTVRATAPAGSGLDLDVDLAPLRAAGAPPFRIGDSIALSGVCCTIVTLDGGDVARFHLTPETLERTWLGRAAVGTPLNLEAALRAGDPLGGHMVQGHVDGTAAVTAAIHPRDGGELGVRVPASLRRYCVEKGSITLDGVSLTIAGLVAGGDGAELRIAVIPHTAQVTTLGQKGVGEALHVEVDVIAKYVEQMLAARGLGGGGREA